MGFAKEVLYGKYLNLLWVIELVLPMAILICSHGLNHFQFHEFLSKVEIKYTDMPYHVAI